MLNHITIMGRMVRDPELRHTQKGTAVTGFTVAVERDRKEDGTDFIDVTAWGKTAEFVCKYFGKGRMAVVEGRLQFRDWIDREGNKRKSAEVVANSIYFGDSKRPESDSREPDYVPPMPGFEEMEDDNGELPFN